MGDADTPNYQNETSFSAGCEICGDELTWAYNGTRCAAHWVSVPAEIDRDVRECTKCGVEVRTKFKGANVVCPDCFIPRNEPTTVPREHVCTSCRRVFTNTYTGISPVCSDCNLMVTKRVSREKRVAEKPVCEHACCKCGFVFRNRFSGENPMCARCNKK